MLSVSHQAHWQISSTHQVSAVTFNGKNNNLEIIRVIVGVQEQHNSEKEQLKSYNTPFYVATSCVSLNL